MGCTTGMRWEGGDDATVTYVGVDEAGRGCLAGPVYAGAVIWRRRPDTLSSSDEKILRDSKTLSQKQRARARAIIETQADAWAVGTASPREIDQHNILGATMLAMHRAIDQVVSQEANSSSGRMVLLVDGDRFKPYISRVTKEFVQHTCITEGDSKIIAIAAASILAKTHKDEFMQGEEAHQKYPQYGWDRNAGYGTAAHMQALREHGPCDMHRKSFAPCSSRGAPPP